MRANVMQIANYEFVESARALGASDAYYFQAHCPQFFSTNDCESNINDWWSCYFHK